MPVTEKLTLGFVAIVILGLLALGSMITKKENICEDVCAEYKGCKTENVVEGKWYNYLEIECNDGSKLQITKEKK